LHIENTFLVYKDKDVFLYDILTGEIVGEYGYNQFATGGINIISGNNIFHFILREIVKYDFKSGKKIYHKDFPFPIGILGFFANEDKVFFSGYDCYLPYCKVICLDTLNDEILWEVGYGIYKCTILEKGILIVLKANFGCTDTSFYEISGIDAKIGRTIWSKPFNIDEYKINVHNDQIIIDTYYGYTINRFYMNIETGEFEGIYSYSVDKIFSKYVFNDNKFYGLQGDTLYCYKLWDK